MLTYKYLFQSVNKKIVAIMTHTWHSRDKQPAARIYTLLSVIVKCIWQWLWQSLSDLNQMRYKPVLKRS